MDMKEKLVELLCKVQDYGTKNSCEGWSVTVECKDNETIADHLISNGVTVVDKFATTEQQWISVKDRLPEQTDPATAVLGITERGRCHIVYYLKGVTSEEFTGFYDACAKREITHWMPLPQPPKGE